MTDDYKKGYADAMGWKTENHLEHWPSAAIGKETLQDALKRENTTPPQRNDVLEEVAKEFDKMPFGDTAASFAIFVRNMKT